MQHALSNHCTRLTRFATFSCGEMGQSVPKTDATRWVCPPRHAKVVVVPCRVDRGSCVRVVGVRVINPSPEVGTTLTPHPTYILSSCRVLVEACCVFVAVVVMRSRCDGGRWVVVCNGEWGNERTLESQGTTNSPVIPATQKKARLYYADVVNRNAVPISSLSMFSSSHGSWGFKDC